MCGITGLMFEVDPTHASAPQFIEDIKDLFSTTLLGIMNRGSEATGVALLNRDGSMVVTKHHLKADKFVESEAYDEFLSHINTDVIGLIGHTRQHTQGTQWNNINNHPHICGRTVGIHNGSIRNDGEKMNRFKLQTSGQCDSEAIFRLYDWAREKLEWPMAKALKLVQEQLRGYWACAMFSGWDPGKLILFRSSGSLNIARLAYKSIQDKLIFAFNSDLDVIASAAKPHINIELHEWNNCHTIEDDLAVIVEPSSDFERIKLTDTTTS